MRALAVGAALVLALAPAAMAQRAGGAPPPEPAGVVSRHFDDSITARGIIAPAIPFRLSDALRPYAPVASAILPGAGQFMLGDDRFIGYVALEVLSWWAYVKDKHEQRAQEAAFKELARNVARIHFSATLPDGDWAYYEQMRDKIESGRYSMNEGGPVIPETDTATYNGTRWVLAQGLYANHAEALAFYESTAIKPEFRWSWHDHQLEYDVFVRTTDKRNDASRAGIRDLMVIGANHVLSMVDAFATVRLQVRLDSNGRPALGVSVPW